MKQRLLLLLTALLASASMLAETGDTFTRNGVKYEVMNDPDGIAWVVGYEDWLNGEVKILENINGYLVTGIGNSAFDGCEAMTSVSIPSTVTQIGSYAFMDCTGLKSVAIPGSVTVIENAAFMGCTGLTSLTLPEGVTHIYDNAFYGCEGMKSVTLPTSIEYIGAYAFVGCTSVEDIYCYAEPDFEWVGRIAMFVDDHGGNVSPGWVLVDESGNFYVYFNGDLEPQYSLVEAPGYVRCEVFRLEYTYFKEDGTTKCHVNGSQLEPFMARWKTGNWESDITVEFVGDLDAPTLTDDLAYTRTIEATVTSVTYQKTLDTESVGNHQAWLLPFDYPIKEADLEKFSFYKINMMANSPYPSQETTTDEMWVFLTKMDEGDVLRANMPYVMKPKEAVTDYLFTTANTALKAPATDMIAKTETMTDIFSFYAIYEPTSPRLGYDFYYVNDGGSISHGEEENSDVTVGPYRWIVIQKSKSSGSASYVHKMYFVDDDDVTGIDDLTLAQSHANTSPRKVLRNGQVLIQHDGKTYTLTGVEVTR